MLRSERKHTMIGLIGSEVSGSLSPLLHQREGDRHGLRNIFTTIDTAVVDIDSDNLGEAIAWCRRLGFRGLNITHPFKQEVVPHLDVLSDDARALGAVNTVVFEDGRSYGYNTDSSGFLRAFERDLPDVRRVHVLQLGAGGAGVAVAHAMLTLGTRTLTVIDVDEAKAVRLRDAMAAEFGSDRVILAQPDALLPVLAHSEGLINATPVGMDQLPGSPVPASALRPDLWVADVVYRPADTELLEAARRVGARTLSGLGMNLYQAVECFEHFTGRQADIEAMRADQTELTRAGA